MLKIATRQRESSNHVFVSFRKLQPRTRLDRTRLCDHNRSIVTIVANCNSLSL